MKPKKRKTGLGNPGAVVAASTATEMAVKGAPKAAKAVGSVAKKADSNTGGAFSWVLLLSVAAGVYTVWKLTAPLRSGAGAVSNVIDSGSGAVSTVIDTVAEHFKDIFGKDENGRGFVLPGVDTNYKPPGATINVTQAANQAAVLYGLFKSLGKLSEPEKQQLYAVFLNKNSTDYKMISDAFGTPKRNALTGGIGFGLDPKINLMEWITIELGPAGINFLKTITHNIF